MAFPLVPKRRSRDTSGPERLESVKARVSALVRSLRSFDVVTIERRDDWKANALASLVNSTLADIFGQGSREYEEYSILSFDTLPAGADVEYALPDVRRAYQGSIRASAEKLRLLLEALDKEQEAADEAAPPVPTAGTDDPERLSDQKVSLVTMRARMRKKNSPPAASDAGPPDEKEPAGAGPEGARPVPARKEATTPEPDVARPRKDAAGAKGGVERNDRKKTGEKDGGPGTGPAAAAAVAAGEERKDEPTAASGQEKETSSGDREAEERSEGAGFGPEGIPGEAVEDDLSDLLGEMAAAGDEAETARTETVRFGEDDLSFLGEDAVTTADTVAATGDGELPAGTLDGPAGTEAAVSPLVEPAADEAVPGPPAVAAQKGDAGAGPAVEAVAPGPPAGGAEQTVLHLLPGRGMAAVLPAAFPVEGPTALSLPELPPHHGALPFPVLSLLHAVLALPEVAPMVRAAPGLRAALLLRTVLALRRTAPALPVTRVSARTAPAVREAGKLDWAVPLTVVSLLRAVLALPGAAPSLQEAAATRAPEPRVAAALREALAMRATRGLSGAAPALPLTRVSAGTALTIREAGESRMVPAVAPRVEESPEGPETAREARERATNGAARDTSRDLLPAGQEFFFTLRRELLLERIRELLSLREEEEGPDDVPVTAADEAQTPFADPAPEAVAADDAPAGPPDTGRVGAPEEAAAEEISREADPKNEEAPETAPDIAEAGPGPVEEPPPPAEQNPFATKQKEHPARKAAGAAEVRGRIEALMGRIEEMRSFDVAAIKERYDPGAEALRVSVNKTLADIFGDNTRAYWHHSLPSFEATQSAGGGPKRSANALRTAYKAGIDKAVAKLEAIVESLKGELGAMEHGTAAEIEPAPGKAPAGRKSVAQQEQSPARPGRVKEPERPAKEEAARRPARKPAPEAPPAEQNPFATKQKEHPARKAAGAAEVRGRIEALMGRIEEMRSFDVAAIKERYDPGAEALRVSVNKTLADIFGDNTRAYWHHSLPSFEATQSAGGGPKRSANALRTAYKAGIDKAVAKLEAIVESLKGELEQQGPDPQ